MTKFLLPLMNRYINLYLKLILIVVSLISISISYGQNSIKGTIYLASNRVESIPNVRVTLTDTVSGAIVAYSFTKADGSFEMNMSGKTLPLKMEASAMGYQKIVLILDEWPVGPISIALTEGAFELNEVKVVAPIVSLKGDTLNYMTSGFYKDGDRTIEEVLKRIPGIEVAVSGEIRYNDTPINALYIDGKNILGEKYSIATKNMNPNLIAMIQVFENHQPVKALKGFTPVESAAVNLQLSPEAKAEWIASADLAVGMGVPLFDSAPLYDSKLLLFRFDSKLQTMNVIRGNNRGMPVQEDLKTHYVGAAAQSRLLVTDELNLVNVTGVLAPSIGEKRVLFNNGGYISSNSLFAIGDKSEVSVKVSYSIESKEKEQQQYTTYFLGDSETIVIGEKSIFSGLVHCPEADIKYKSNSEAYFMQARVNFRGRFQDNLSDIYTSQNLNSHAFLNQYDVSGIFTWIKPYKNSVFKLSSNTLVSSLPQRLHIERQYSREEPLVDSLSQDISLKRILSNNGVEFTNRWGFFSVVTDAGLDLRYEKLSNNFYNGYFNNLPTNNSNNNCLLLSVLHVSPSLRFDNKRLFVNTSVPLKLFNTNLKLTPELSIRYKISSYWEVISSFMCSVNFTDITSVYTGPLMVNYRVYKSGTDKMAQNTSKLFVLKAIYNNPLKLLNLYASFSRSLISNETTTHYNYFDSSGSLFDVAYVHLSEFFEPAQNNSSSLMLNFTKSFFDFPLLINIKLTGIDTKSQMVQQDVFTENRYKFYSVFAALDFSLGASTDISVKLPYSETNRESVLGVKASSSLSSFNPSLNAVFKLSKKTRVAINTTLNLNELSQGLYYLYPFADVNIQIKLKKGELYAEATNIFDNREYRYKNTGDLFITEMVYKLRPFSFIAGYSFSF